MAKQLFNLGWFLLVCSLLGGANIALARPTFAVDIECAASIDEPAIAYGLKVGIQLGAFRPFIQMEHNPWFYFDTKHGMAPGVLNTALGIEIHFFENRARSSLAIGNSALLFDTALDFSGQNGLFFDLRPMGFRFSLLGNWLYLVFDPLHIAFVAPILSDIPLYMAQYRATLTIEFQL